MISLQDISETLKDKQYVIKKLLTGKYVTVQKFAHSYETTEEDARRRFEELEEQGVVRKIAKDRYIADTDDKNELIREVRGKFRDLDDELVKDVGEYLE